MTYQEYVKAAKILLCQIESHQAKIAEMCASVCQIRHGGKSSGYYTISDFANDIGVHNKTLSGWVSIYRNVVLKVGLTNPTKEQWRNASITSTVLKNERTVINSMSGTERSKGDYKKDISSEKVKELYEGVARGECDNLKLDRIFHSTRHNLKMIQSINIESVNRSVLLRIMEMLDEHSDYINDVLTIAKQA